MSALESEPAFQSEQGPIQLEWGPSYVFSWVEMNNFRQADIISDEPGCE